MMNLDGLAGELLAEIRKIPVIDCHEHLPPEKERIAQKIDVTTLFTHYCRSDLEAAGLPQGKAQDAVFDTSKPLMPRWKKLKPYFEAIRHGSYAYPVLAYVRDVLGHEDITDETVENISEKLQATQKKGLYKKVIQGLCGIETCVVNRWDMHKDDLPFFVYLMPDRTEGDSFQIDWFETATGMRIHSLKDLTKALRTYVEDEVKKGAVGYKVGAAYHRKIEYLEVPRSEAEKVFIKFRRSRTAEVSAADRRLLEDYLIRVAVEACIDQKIPVVIHTGYQAGNRNDIRNARATHLWHLLKSYPEAKFDLFHGSFPYVEDMVVLGKYFANVTLNMCWMHIMSPSISRRALDAWLDAVPATKIFAFGGDYIIVEKIYGHLDLARADVAMVLADKIKLGRLTETDALKVARLLFYENPKRWYRI